MNLLVVIPIIAVIVILNLLRSLKIPLLVWVSVWWMAIYLVLSQGFTAPLPVSIISKYMMIVSLSLLVYIVSDRERLRAVKEPLVSFMTDKKYAMPLMIVLIILPLLVAYKVYSNTQVEILAPGFSRSAHPAPPNTINFAGKTIDLIRGSNPFRKYEKSDKPKFVEHVKKGKNIFYQNCFYCHGDALQGQGLYAYGLDPLPTNFQDPATIGMLQEGFLFWRIAEGGIGLPNEGGPWASAMPAWKDFLSEDDIWNVILFLYDYTGNKPRAVEHHE